MNKHPSSGGLADLDAYLAHAVRYRGHLVTRGFALEMEAIMEGDCPVCIDQVGNLPALDVPPEELEHPTHVQQAIMYSEERYALLTNWRL